MNYERQFYPSSKMSILLGYQILGISMAFNVVLVLCICFNEYRNILIIQDHLHVIYTCNLFIPVMQQSCKNGNGSDMISNGNITNFKQVGKYVLYVAKTAIAKNGVLILNCMNVEKSFECDVFHPFAQQFSSAILKTVTSCMTRH